MEPSAFDLSSFTSKSQNQALNEQLVLEYLNEAGENVFENNTYDPNEVTVGTNGQYYQDVVDLYNEETKFLIWINGYSEGKNSYTISLSPTSSKMELLTVYTTMTDFDSCSGPKFAIDSVFYNSEIKSLKEISAGLKKLTITQ